MLSQPIFPPLPVQRIAGIHWGGGVSERRVIPCSVTTPFLLSRRVRRRRVVGPSRRRVWTDPQVRQGEACFPFFLRICGGPRLADFSWRDRELPPFRRTMRVVARSCPPTLFFPGAFGLWAFFRERNGLSSGESGEAVTEHGCLGSRLIPGLGSRSFSSHRRQTPRLRLRARFSCCLATP